VVEAGIKPEPYLRKAGLTVQQIKNRSARLDAQAQIRFVELAAQALDDDFLGFHLARKVDLREIGFLYYIMASAETLGDALPRIARYSGIANEGVAIRCLARKGIVIAFDYVGVLRHADRHQIEAWVTLLVRSCRHMTGTDLAPNRVTFTHYRTKVPPEVSAFLGGNIAFGADADEVEFSKTIATMPIVTADPYLEEMLIVCCEEALTRRGTRRGAFRSNVENAAALLLPHGKAGADEIARRLGLSRRTLARRLASEGLTIGGIVNDLRRDLAKRYLDEPGLSISRIAWLLGYQEISAFTNAFKRWTGKSPNQIRSKRASPTKPRKRPASPRQNGVSDR
jgi:AraC-like DNA-binding protein